MLQYSPSGALFSVSHALTAVAHHLLKPLKSQSAWRPVLSRLQIIIQLLQDNGMTPESGFSVDSVMTFCVASFDSANGQVVSACNARSQRMK